MKNYDEDEMMTIEECNALARKSYERIQKLKSKSKAVSLNSVKLLKEISKPEHMEEMFEKSKVEKE